MTLLKHVRGCIGNGDFSGGAEADHRSSSESYPTLGICWESVEQEIETIVEGSWREGEKILVERKLVNLDSIRSNLRTLVNTYGDIFNGPTSIDNMKDVKAISYDLSGLKELDARIFDLELFNLLSLAGMTQLLTEAL